MCKFQLNADAFLIAFLNRLIVVWDFYHFFKLSKQELYFVKENYEIFSAEITARETLRQNTSGPHQGVIGAPVISPVGGHFEFVRRLGST